MAGVELTETHTTPIEVTPDMLGQLGHLDHIDFAPFIHQAQLDYLRSRGLTLTGLVERRLGAPVVKEALLQHADPLKAGPASITTRVHQVQTTSFRGSHQVLNAEGIPVATARYAFVMRDLSDGSPMAVADGLRRLFLPKGASPLPGYSPDREIYETQIPVTSNNVTTREVDPSSLGRLGHLDHHRYAGLLQDVQLEWLEKAGLSLEILRRRFRAAPVVRYSNIRHTGEVKAGSVEIGTDVGRIAPNYFDVFHTISSSEGNLLTIAKYSFALIGLRGPQPLDERLRALLELSRVPATED
jgi:acyl-CoA thioesterase FadM